MNIDKQKSEFLRIVKTNPNISYVLKNFVFPNGKVWYLVGGSVNQTVWNYLTKRSWDYGIGDYDIHYWDEDRSDRQEKKIQALVASKLDRLGVEIEVTNQARVHEWFGGYFGVDMVAYTSLDQAISTPPSTVTCIGVTKRSNEEMVFAPYGLDDVFSMTLRYNPQTYIPADHVLTKVAKWKSKWPELNVIESSYPKRG